MYTQAKRKENTLTNKKNEKHADLENNVKYSVNKQLFSFWFHNTYGEGKIFICFRSIYKKFKKY